LGNGHSRRTRGDEDRERQPSPEPNPAGWSGRKGGRGGHPKGSNRRRGEEEAAEEGQRRGAKGKGKGAGWDDRYDTVFDPEGGKGWCHDDRRPAASAAGRHGDRFDPSATDGDRYAAERQRNNELRIAAKQQLEWGRASHWHGGRLMVPREEDQDPEDRGDRPPSARRPFAPPLSYDREARDPSRPTGAGSRSPPPAWA